MVKQLNLIEPDLPLRFRVVGYCRVSTEQQVREGHGLDVQRQALRDYCEQHGHELLRLYEDAGISGAAEEEDDLLKREGLQDLLADLPRLKPDRVIVLNTSRLWRSTLAKAQIQLSLRKQKVDVMSIDQPTYSVYTKDPSDFLINAIMEVIDEFQRLEIALKLRRGKLHKAKEGGFAGGQRAYGYQARGDHDLAVDPEELAVVQRIREMRQAGGSYQAIARTLNEERVPTKRGGQWWAARIRYICHNLLYEGVIQHAGIATARADLALPPEEEDTVPRHCGERKIATARADLALPPEEEDTVPRHCGERKIATARADLALPPG
jgi:DNA invertase Pin-like site-specific DNA recombinase